MGVSACDDLNHEKKKKKGGGFRNPRVDLAYMCTTQKKVRMGGGGGVQEGPGKI